jgi:hypothetical protein
MIDGASSRRDLAVPAVTTLMRADTVQLEAEHAG